MKYEARMGDGFSVIIDEDGNSISRIECQHDFDIGANVLTPVFTPEMADKITRALNGETLTVTLETDATEVTGALGKASSALDDMASVLRSSVDLMTAIYTGMALIWRVDSEPSGGVLVKEDSETLADLAKTIQTGRDALAKYAAAQVAP